GDATPPAGGYAGALDLLTDLSSMAAPFQHLGVAAYPEPHPIIADDVLIQAMWDKRDYATHLVSNLCFDPATIASWAARRSEEHTSELQSRLELVCRRLLEE